MPNVEGYTDEQIFEIATKFAKESNRVYIAEAIERLIDEAQSKVLEILSKQDVSGSSFCNNCDTHSVTIMVNTFNICYNCGKRKK